MSNRLRFGFSGVCANKVPLQAEAISTITIPSHDFIAASVRDDRRRLALLTEGFISDWLSPRTSARSIWIPCGLPARLVYVFRLDDLAHELSGKPGVLVCEFDPDCFTIHHGQLVAQLVAGVTVVANLVPG